MEAHLLLLEQTRHHYHWLGRAIEGLDEALAGRELPGAPPPLTWQVTHLIEQVESTAEALCGQERPPGDLPSDWGGLVDRLKASMEKAVSGLAGLGPEELESPPLVPLHPGLEEALRTRLRWWSGHVFHVAYHLGQIGSLRSAHGLGWPS